MRLSGGEEKLNLLTFNGFPPDNRVRDAGVAGSNPATPTICSCHSFFRTFSDCWRFPSQPRIPLFKPNTGLRSRGAWRPRLAGFTLEIRACRESRVHAAPVVSCRDAYTELSRIEIGLSATRYAEANHLARLPWATSRPMMHKTDQNQSRGSECVDVVC